MGLTDHPLRRRAVDEMHLRRFAPVPEQCEIRQSVRLLSADDRHAEDNWLIGDRPDFDAWGLRDRHAMGSTKDNIAFIWERHSEASTITLILPQDCAPERRADYIRWMELSPGRVVRATRVFVVPDFGNIEALLDHHKMDRGELVGASISGGLNIWSDFGIRDDGYGRLLVNAGEVSAAERGRIIQRLQELGNYRNMALLGLPLVEEYGPQADALEQQLSDHAERVALARDGDQDDALLQELIEISSRLEVIRSATGFRLSATAAYASVAADRLEALHVQQMDDWQDLAEFTQKRLVPAARTCSVFTERLARIAERISRVMHTLDVRVDTRIKAQNLLLTKRMERSIQMQFRLQSLVEGLSVIAAAYYLIGLISFMIKGAVVWPDWNSPDGLIGLLTLPVIIVIYLFVRRTKGLVLKDADLDSAKD